MKDLLNVLYSNEVMENGEQRFRLKTENGSGYVLTASKEGGWQKSHYHERAAEFYVVEKGSATLYTLVNGKVVSDTLEPGDSILCQPNVHHNLFLAPETLLHTIKIGDDITQDWVTSEELEHLLAAYSS